MIVLQGEKRPYYFPDSEISWANKYFWDALSMKERLEFENTAHIPGHQWEYCVFAGNDTIYKLETGIKKRKLIWRGWRNRSLILFCRAGSARH